MIPLTYVGNPGNAASTAYFCWGAPSQAAVAAASQVTLTGQTTHMAGFAGKVRTFSIKTGQLTAGGTVTLVLVQNGGSAGFQIQIAAGTAAGTVFSAPTGGPATIAIGDRLEMQLVNGAGVTASVGLSMVTMLLSIG